MLTASERRTALLVIAVGVILRLTTLSHHSLWLDEAFSVWTSTTNAAAAIWAPDFDAMHPSLYYLTLHQFLPVAGITEVMARMPSALASILGIGLMYVIGERLFPTRRVGLWCAALMAAAPIDFWYAQEARMYECVVASSLIFTLGLVIDDWWAVPFTIVGLVAGVYFDHTMWLVAIIVVSGWGVRWWHRGLSMASLTRVAVGVAIALALSGRVWARASFVYSQLDKVSLFKNLGRVLGVQSLTVVPFAVVLLVCVASCVAFAALLWAIGRQPSSRSGLALAIVTAFVVATLAVVVPRAYSVKQVLVCLWPFVILCVVWASEWVDRRTMTMAMTVSAAGLMATFWTPRADWRGVAASFASRTSTSAVIVLDPPYNARPFGFYRPTDPVVPGPIESTEAFATAASKVSEACLVAERFGGALPTSTSEAWLDAHFALVSATPFARLELRCYRPRP